MYLAKVSCKLQAGQIIEEATVQSKVNRAVCCSKGTGNIASQVCQSDSDK